MCAVLRTIAHIEVCKPLSAVVHVRITCSCSSSLTHVVRHIDSLVDYRGQSTFSGASFCSSQICRALLQAYKIDVCIWYSNSECCECAWTARKSGCSAGVFRCRRLAFSISHGSPPLTQAAPLQSSRQAQGNLGARTSLRSPRDAEAALRLVERYNIFLHTLSYYLTRLHSIARSLCICVAHKTLISSRLTRLYPSISAQLRAKTY